MWVEGIRIHVKVRLEQDKVYLLVMIRVRTDGRKELVALSLTAPNGTFNNVLGLIFAAPIPPTTPLDEDATNNPPPSADRS